MADHQRQVSLARSRSTGVLRSLWPALLVAAVLVWYASDSPEDAPAAPVRLTAAARHALSQLRWPGDPPEPDSALPGPDLADADDPAFAARRQRTRELLRRAAQLAPADWNPIVPAHAAQSPVRLNYTEDGRPVADERVKDYFAYFMGTLAASVGREEAASRLLASLADMPEPGRSRMKGLVEGYLATEDALEEHARQVHASRSGMERERALSRIQSAMQTDDPHAQDGALHQLYQSATTVQKDRERIVLANGGEDIAALYAATNGRASVELQLALTFTDTSLDVRTQLDRALAIHGLKAGQPIDEPTGAVRLAYAGLDTRAIETNRRLSEAEKQQLRLDYFGPAYVNEHTRLFGPAAK